MTQTKSPGGRPRHPDCDNIIAMAMEGKTQSEIADALECTKATVNGILCRARVEGIDVPRQKRGPKFRSELRDHTGAVGRAALREAGEMLYGPYWVSPLARQLGIDNLALRTYAAGTTPIPDTITLSLPYVLRTEASAGRRIADKLDAYATDFVNKMVL